MSRPRTVPSYLYVALTTAAIGLAPVSNSLTNVRIALLHGADMLQLISIGWCYGIAIACLVVYFRGSTTASISA